jgi:hypothetical protein
MTDQALVFEFAQFAEFEISIQALVRFFKAILIVAFSWTIFAIFCLFVRN